MRPDDIAAVLELGRFSPFKLRLSNGDVYEVRHPDQVVVTRSTLAIGTGRRNGTRWFERVVTVSLLHVVSIVPMEETEVT
jgi:hypothetical protein